MTTENECTQCGFLWDILEQGLCWYCLCTTTELTLEITKEETPAERNARRIKELEESFHIPKAK